MTHDLRHDDGSHDYRHCPMCGGKLESRVVLQYDPPRLVCSACGFVFYLDPKVAVGAIASRDGDIVLLRRAIDPGYGKWVFPGGYVDRGETLEQAVRREVMEEVNAEIRLGPLLNAYSYEGGPVIVIVFAAELLDERELRGGDEALEVRMFAPHEIPWKELAFRSTRQALREYLDRQGVTA